MLFSQWLEVNKLHSFRKQLYKAAINGMLPGARVKDGVVIVAEDLKGVNSPIAVGIIDPYKNIEFQLRMFKEHHVRRVLTTANKKAISAIENNPSLVSKIVLEKYCGLRGSKIPYMGIAKIYIESPSIRKLGMARKRKKQKRNAVKDWEIELLRKIGNAV